MLASHTWFLSTPFIALIQNKQKMSSKEKFLPVDLNWEELLHTPTHAHVNSPFLSTQTVAGSEVGEDACSSDSNYQLSAGKKLANMFCFSICSLFCLISQLVQKPHGERVVLFIGSLQDTQQTAHTKHLAEYLDGHLIFVKWMMRAEMYKSHQRDIGSQVRAISD